jgi:hypothetical protein
MNLDALITEATAALAAAEPSRTGFKQVGVTHGDVTLTLTFTPGRGWRHPEKTTRQFKRDGKVVALAALKAEAMAGAASAVAEAVKPRREACVARALASAEQFVGQVMAQLEAAGWDADKVAPRPTSGMGRGAYRAAAEFCAVVCMLTSPTRATCMPGQPNIVTRNEKGIARFMDNARKDAEAQFDLYVQKLAEKIGFADSAELDGGALWDGSYLTVRKGQATEVWKTTQIVNCSVLGKLFNQWPTRQFK